MRCAALSVALLALLASLSKAQQVEKLELTLAPPTYNTDRGDGYQFEMRGNLYPKGVDASCSMQPTVSRIGTYLLRVRYFKPDNADFPVRNELIATWVINIGSALDIQQGRGRQVVFESYSNYQLDEFAMPLSFAYEGIVLRSTQKALTEYTPQLPDCFGGKLVLYFLNGG